MYKTYLSTLKAGTYTAELTFEDGSKAAIGLAVSNSAQSAVSPNQITFDKYEQSANYADQTVNVVLPAGTRLDSIKIGSTVLERGTDYTYNATNGTIRLLKETLAKEEQGHLYGYIRTQSGFVLYLLAERGRYRAGERSGSGHGRF